MTMNKTSGLLIKWFNGGSFLAEVFLWKFSCRGLIVDLMYFVHTDSFFFLQRFNGGSFLVILSGKIEYLVP